MESNEVIPNLLKQEQIVYQNYIKSLKDESMWRLKSRSVWLQAGDKNMSFFHKQAKVRQWCNMVEEIKTHSREVLSSFEDIKHEASLHYGHMYT
jgi:hypothetical protein